MESSQKILFAGAAVAPFGIYQVGQMLGEWNYDNNTLAPAEDAVECLAQAPAAGTSAEVSTTCDLNSLQSEYADDDKEVTHMFVNNDGVLTQQTIEAQELAPLTEMQAEAQLALEVVRDQKEADVHVAGLATLGLSVALAAGILGVSVARRKVKQKTLIVQPPRTSSCVIDQIAHGLPPQHDDAA